MALLLYHTKSRRFKQEVHELEVIGGILLITSDGTLYNHTHHCP